MLASVILSGNSNKPSPPHEPITIIERRFGRIHMATQAKNLATAQSQALVKITEMDHIVLRVKDVEVSLRFYCETLGMQSERVDQWKAGEVRFTFTSDWTRTRTAWT